MILLAVGFVATVMFFAAAQVLDLSLLSGWPGGRKGSPRSYAWALLIYPALAARFWLRNRKAGNSEPGAAPNGGPAMRPDNSGASGGPPSVSRSFGGGVTMKTCCSLLLVLGLAGCATRYTEPPKSWQSVRLGMSRQEVRALVGPSASHEEAHRDAQKDSVIYEREHWEVRTGPSTVAGLDVSWDEDGHVVSVGPSTLTAHNK